MNNFLQEPKAGYGYIYKYTSPSNKSYIGQTVKSLKKRAKNNGYGYKSCKAFYRAIQKYGFKNFKYEILGEFLIEELNEKEIHYISIENTMIPNGYNIYKGGTNDYNSSRKTKIKQYDLNGKFIKLYNSLEEAAKDNNTVYQAISAVLLKKRRQHKGFIYRYEDEETPNPVIIKQTHGRKTAQYDLNGNLIKIYDSANQAGIAVNGNGRNIRSVCAGQRTTAYGFKWKYLD